MTPDEHFRTWQQQAPLSRDRYFDQHATEIAKSALYASHKARSLGAAREPTALEIRKYDELVTHDVLAAVRFLVSRGVAVDPALVPQSATRECETLGRIAESNYDLTRRARQEKEAIYCAEHGKDVTTAAAALSNAGEHIAARDLLSAYGYIDAAREQNAIAIADAAAAKAREDAIQMILRDLPEREAAAAESRADAEKAEQYLFRRYGANPSGEAFAEERMNVFANVEARREERMAKARALAEKKYDEQQAALNAPRKPSGPVADVLRQVGALPAEGTGAA